jgi:hypothetical protein
MRTAVELLSCVQDEDLTCDVVNGRLATVVNRTATPQERQGAVDWLVQKSNTGEIRDVDPGFNDRFYELLFAAIHLALDDSKQLTCELAAPDEHPMPTDGASAFNFWR